jgi:hypothetical protein
MPKIPKDWSKVHESFPIFECISPWIEWQKTQRSNPSLSAEIRSGINFSIVLGLACYIEGYLERFLLRVVNSVNEQSVSLLQRLLDDFRLKISSTTGSEGYDQLFALALGKKASEIVDDRDLWETVKVLFLFRNVIAHGRAVGYLLYFPPEVGGYWEERFSGGYKKVEDFLIKKGLLNSRHIEEADNWHYFTYKVADLFWDASIKFKKILDEIN